MREPDGSRARTLAELRRWRALRPELEILLVRGNHDRHAGDPPEDLRINCLNAPAFVPPFVLRHEPADSADGYTLAGHLHPGLVLSGPGRWERLPCFWLTVAHGRASGVRQLHRHGAGLAGAERPDLRHRG